MSRSPGGGVGRRPALAEDRLAVRPEAVTEAVGTLAEPGEVLIQDDRGTLTPAEMVEQKLLTLLRQSRRRGPSRF